MLTTLITALLTAPAAAGNQIDLELGSQIFEDEAWGLFTDYGSQSTYGLRAGFAVSEQLSVLAGYYYASSGTNVGYGYLQDGAPGDSFIAAASGHTLALGPKLAARSDRIFSPYGTAQLTARYTTLRLDADPVIDDDATQISASGFTPGAALAAGLDIVLPPKERSWTPALFFELGYGYTLDTRFGDLGRMSASGTSLRWGLGARF